MSSTIGVLEELNSLLEKRILDAKRDFDEAVELEKQQNILESVFNNYSREGDFSFLSNSDLETFVKAINLLANDIDPNQLKKLKAIHFLVNNEVDLVDSQVQLVTEFCDTAKDKIELLEKKMARKKAPVKMVNEYKDIKDELLLLANKGVIDRPLLERIFTSLNIKGQDQDKYIDDALRMGVSRYLELTNAKDNQKDTNEESIVSENNLEILEEVKLEKEEEINLDNIKLIFEKNGFDRDILSDSLLELIISKVDCAKVDSILRSLRTNDIVDLFDNRKVLTRLIIDSDKKIIDEYCELFNKYDLSKDYIKKYIAVFFPSNGREEKLFDSSVEFEGRSNDFIKNLEILSNLGYDSKTLLERNVMVLLEKNSKIIKSITELSMYGYDLENNNVSLSALRSQKIADITDAFIEIGEEEYIRKYSSALTRFTDEGLDRLYALKAKGIPCFTDGARKTLRKYVLDSSVKCGVTPEELYSYVPNDSVKALRGNKYKTLIDNETTLTISKETLEDPIIEQLDERFKINGNTYNMDGVLVSRIKLLRNYEFLKQTDKMTEEEKDVIEILWVSALYNSRMTISQMERIDNCLNICKVAATNGGKDGILKK